MTHWLRERTLEAHGNLGVTVTQDFGLSSCECRTQVLLSVKLDAASQLQTRGVSGADPFPTHGSAVSLPGPCPGSPRPGAGHSLQLAHFILFLKWVVIHLMCLQLSITLTLSHG